MKNIFSYSDYRRFLADFYDHKKSVGEYSYRRFSQKAGLNSPNYLALIIDGKRDLTVANIHQFAAATGLRSDETEYFEALVLLNQASTIEEKSFYEDRRRKLVRNKPKDVSRKNPGTALRELYYSAVMVLAHDRSFEDSVAKARAELGLKVSEIQVTLNDLISLGLLEKRENGLLKISSAQITFNDPKGFSRAQENFLLAQLQQSLRAFRQTYKEKTGKFISHTLTITPDSIDKIHHRLISFVEELTEEMDAVTENSSARAAQINIQIFHPRKWG